MKGKGQDKETETSCRLRPVTPFFILFFFFFLFRKDEEEGEIDFCRIMSQSDLTCFHVIRYISIFSVTS